LKSSTPKVVVCVELGRHPVYIKYKQMNKYKEHMGYILVRVIIDSYRSTLYRLVQHNNSQNDVQIKWINLVKTDIS